MTSDATYHAHWQQSQELRDRGAQAGGGVIGRGAAADAPTPPPNAREAARRDLDHLLAALSVEKSKTIAEIRDLYGLNEGERP